MSFRGIFLKEFFAKGRLTQTFNLEALEDRLALEHYLGQLATGVNIENEDLMDVFQASFHTIKNKNNSFSFSYTVNKKMSFIILF